MKKAILSLILVLLIVLCSACSGGEPTTVADNNSKAPTSSLLIEDENFDKSKTILLSGSFSPKASIKTVSLQSKTSKTAAAFSYELFKNSYSDDNALISPISIMYALAMTQNGAEGNTLAQIENAFGADRETINAYLKSYLASADESLSLSQSLWIYSDFAVKNSFLQKNADYFNADIYSTPMDNTTLSDINKWISDKTDGEIEKALDRIEPNTDIFLINATLFNGKWAEDYSDTDLSEGDFKNADGTSSKVTYLHSTETIYLGRYGFSGFAKPYNSGRYVFTALLPDENSSLSELVSSLDGDDFSELINEASGDRVIVKMPEFEIKYDAPLLSMLRKAGITDAFDANKANFSGMSNNPLYLTRALHSTSIKLNRYGTKAAGSTIIADTTRGPSAQPLTVYLNRPFLYAIYDTQANMPIFIGTVNSLK